MDRLDVFILSSTPLKTVVEILEKHEGGVLSGLVPLYSESAQVLAEEKDSKSKAAGVKILGFHFLATRQLTKELRARHGDMFLFWHEVSKELAIAAPAHVFGPMGSVKTTLDIDDEKKTVSFKGGESVGSVKSENEEDEKKYKIESGSLIERDTKTDTKKVSFTNDR